MFMASSESRLCSTSIKMLPVLAVLNSNGGNILFRDERERRAHAQFLEQSWLVHPLLVVDKRVCLILYCAELDARANAYRAGRNGRLMQHLSRRRSRSVRIGRRCYREAARCGSISDRDGTVLWRVKDGRRSRKIVQRLVVVNSKKVDNQLVAWISECLAYYVSKFRRVERGWPAASSRRHRAASRAR